MNGARRLLAYILSAIAIILAGILVVALLYEHRELPRTAGTISVKGLHGAVEVSRDKAGIPTIRAHDEHDMLFAQGYVTAQDRLWQMEVMRHVGEGRLSELFGERTLDSDRFLHVFGVPRAAAAQDAALDAISRARIQAYVDGVNAYIGGDHPLPPEFVLLHARPEPWTVRQTLAIEKVMALDLSQYFLALHRSKAVQKLGAQRAGALQPPYPSWGPVIVDSAQTAALGTQTAALGTQTTALGTKALIGPPGVPPIAAALIRAGSITNASNAWVIGGTRTASHKPILANDMHLELNAPPIWYLVALHSDSADVVGMSLPGSPYVVAGHNRAIAWGFTNVMLDDADFFIEHPDSADATRYMTPTGPASFVNVADTLHVKGRAAPEILHYRMTRHGPVISDIEKGIANANAVISLQWLGAEPSHAMLALPAFMHATNWADFRSAVALFDDPHQNVVYADTAGHFGYVMGGRVPDRGAHLPPSLPVPGWTGDWDWRGYIPFEQHPATLDPAEGFVVTANNRQAAGALADRISDGWETPFRAMRIREMILDAKKPLTADDVHRMQLDVHDASAMRYRDRAIDAANEINNPTAAKMLSDWDGNATLDSKAAALYYMFYDRLRYYLVRSLYGDDTGWMDRNIVDNVLEERQVPWPNAGSYIRASFDDIAKNAMTDAVRLADGRTWGAMHTVTAAHSLGSVATLDRILQLNIGNVAAAGSETTVNVSQWSGLDTNGRNATFKGTMGPSQRHVVDMGNIDGGGGFILPGGESGLPFASTYRDQWDRWLNGGLITIPLDSAKSRTTAAHILTLTPVSH